MHPPYATLAKRLQLKNHRKVHFTVATEFAACDKSSVMNVTPSPARALPPLQDCSELRVMLDDFRTADFKDQKLTVPEWGDGHSGNTAGASIRLASLWLLDPHLVRHEHGALCPLLGCVEYGCEQAGSIPR